jgi:hypothetical protein
MSTSLVSKSLLVEHRQRFVMHLLALVQVDVEEVEELLKEKQVWVPLVNGELH